MGGGAAGGMVLDTWGNVITVDVYGIKLFSSEGVMLHSQVVPGMHFGGYTDLNAAYCCR